jgi:carboxymethylenebutenolidase
MRLLGTFVLLLVVLVVSTPASAQVESVMVKFKSGDEEGKAFVVQPTGKGPFPVVIVIQEWWGLNDWIKDNAVRFAMKGYIAVAPDLYRGKVADNPGDAGQLMKGLPRDRALRDIKGAIDYALARPDVDKSKIGVIGWCMGGMYSIDAAIANDNIKACVICYGRVPGTKDGVKNLNATVLGVFGEDDKGIPPADVKKFETALKEAGKNIEKINEYKAGHGFMREKNPAGKNPEYREEAAKDAWKQIDAFFAKTLGK